MSPAIDWPQLHPTAGPWVEHVPFAFWIVDALRPRCIVELGTYTGTSYFAFCQAVDRLGIPAACHAVDTWQGDEHGGYYGEEVFSEVSAWNASHYASFSRLVRSSFADARPHFSKGEVDLLHIDGLHTYEAVAADFASWRTALSDTGIVLLHDTCVRERGFGVGRLFQELAAKLPHFEFVHGHGLGVIGVGPRLPAGLQALLAAAADPAATYAIRSRFAARGEAVRQALELREATGQLERLRSELPAMRQRTASAEECLGVAQQHIESLTVQLGSSLDATRDLQGEAATLREQLGQAELSASAAAAQLAAERTRNEAITRELGALHKMAEELDHERHRAEGLEAQLAACLEREAAQADLLRATSGRVDALAGELAEARALVRAQSAELEEQRGQAEALRDARVQTVDLRGALARERLRAAGLQEALWEREARLARQREALHLRLSTEERQALDGQVRLLATCPLFDAEWYLAQNPDVQAGGQDAALHYLVHGADEGRSPGPAFDGPWYLEHHPDVASAGWNPLLHYIAHGSSEGRAIRPPQAAAQDDESVPQPSAAPTVAERLEERSRVTAMQRRSLGTGAGTYTHALPQVRLGIVTYNTPEDELARVVSSAEVALRRAGASLQNSIGILDNGSTTLLDSHSVSRLRPLGNVGFGAGHNALMREAFTGGADLYVAVNPDGVLHPDSLSALQQMASACRHEALIEALQFPDEHPKAYDPVTFDTPWASGACMVIPRKLYEATGGFDEGFFMYCEDVDLSWRARAAGFAVKTCPRALFLHSVAGRGDDAEVRRRHLLSGWRLGRKWRNEAFAKAMAQQLDQEGATVPDRAPEPVPPSWAGVADFSRGFHFAPTRW